MSDAAAPIPPHAFGIKPTGPDVNPDAPWWGARAIFQADGRGGHQIDLVWDRQQCTGGDVDEPACRRLAKWVNDKGIPALRKEIARRRLSPRDRELVEVHDKRAGFVIVADPRASHGYLYMGAAPLLRPARKVAGAFAAAPGLACRPCKGSGSLPGGLACDACGGSGAAP